MKRYLYFLFLIDLLVSLTPGAMLANDSSEEKTAATFFHNQQYQEALAIWQKMVNTKCNAGLYFNIGLAESNLHQPAEAIYAFEQALRLRPLNAMYSKALEEERKKLDNPVIPLEMFFLERWYLGWITFLRPGSWAILGLLILLVALMAYLVSINALPGRTRMPSSAIPVAAIAGIIILSTAFLSFRHLNKQDEGIIIQPCELKQASSVESPVLRPLPAGEKVMIKDKIGEWYYVALLNLDYGWIKSDCFKLITISGAR